MQKFLIKFLLKKYAPEVVFVWGNYGRTPARIMIGSVLAPDYNVISTHAEHFEAAFWKHCKGVWGLLLPIKKAKKLVAVLECEPQEEAYHTLKKLLAVRAIVVTPSSDIPGFTDLFSGEESGVARFRKEIARIHQGPALILNYDDEAVRSLGEKSRLRQTTYGLSAYADMYAGEIKPHAEFDEKNDRPAYETGRLEAGTYAKLHMAGSVVPFHVPHAWGKQHIFAALAALGTANLFGMNAVEAIEGMKHYQAPEGSGNIETGIKETIIVDAHLEATPFFARELLETVERVREKSEEAFRIVVVLSDIPGFGEGDEETQLHKTLGEYIGKVAQEVYLVGERVVFTEETLVQEIGASHVHRY